MTDFLEVPVEVAARDSSLRVPMTDLCNLHIYRKILHFVQNDISTWYLGVEGGRLRRLLNTPLKTKCLSERSEESPVAC